MRYTWSVQELLPIRVLVDQGLERLERQPEDHPLRRLEPLKLRRLLAEAAFRELRNLRREIVEESAEQQ
jgi:hypothetical protein